MISVDRRRGGLTERLLRLPDETEARSDEGHQSPGETGANYCFGGSFRKRQEYGNRSARKTLRSQCRNCRKYFEIYCYKMQ